MRGDDQAFPLAYKPEYDHVDEGLAKREWLAGMALSGLMANPNYNEVQVPIVAKVAFQMADAIIAASKES